MIDTHTHLYLPEFEDGGSAAVERAIESGVRGMVMPNVDLETVDPMLKLKRRYPGVIKIAIGYHPTAVDVHWRDSIDRIKGVFDSNECSAIGEVGIDLYWDTRFREEQMMAFEEQIGWASERGLPVIIHCRKALDEVLEVIEGYKGILPQLLFHSFTGNRGDVIRIREHTDAYFGINGVVTFKNSTGLRDALPEIGIARTVIETDSPYLAPVPYRGKRNESAYIVKVLEMVSVTLGVPLGEADRVTSGNAEKLFGKWEN